MVISEKMRAEIRDLQQAVRNCQDGISLIQTAEGALQEVHAMLQRMNELAVQASNGTLTNDDRGGLQLELNQLMDEINNIAQYTTFNAISLFDWGFSRFIHTGTHPQSNIEIKISDMTTSNLFNNAGGTGIGITGANAILMPDGDYVVNVSKDANNDYYITVTGWVFNNFGRKVLSSESSMSVNYVDGPTHTLTVDFDYTSLREGQVIVRVNNGSATVLQPDARLKSGHRESRMRQ